MQNSPKNLQNFPSALFGAPPGVWRAPSCSPTPQTARRRPKQPGLCNSGGTVLRRDPATAPTQLHFTKLSKVLPDIADRGAQKSTTNITPDPFMLSWKMK